MYNDIGERSRVLHAYSIVTFSSIRRVLGISNHVKSKRGVSPEIRTFYRKIMDRVIMTNLPNSVSRQYITNYNNSIYGKVAYESFYMIHIVRY